MQVVVVIEMMVVLVLVLVEEVVVMVVILEVVVMVMVEVVMVMVEVVMVEVVMVMVEMVMVEAVMVMVEVEVKMVIEVGMVHSHLCGCGLDPPVGDQGPVAPSAGIEGALLCLPVNLHQESLMIQFFVLVG